jgi:hypothetical protein
MAKLLWLLVPTATSPAMFVLERVVEAVLVVLVDWFALRGHGVPRIADISEFLEVVVDLEADQSPSTVPKLPLASPTLLALLLVVLVLYLPGLLVETVLGTLLCPATHDGEIEAHHPR